MMVNISKTSCTITFNQCHSAKCVTAQFGNNVSLTNLRCFILLVTQTTTKQPGAASLSMCISSRSSSCRLPYLHQIPDRHDYNSAVGNIYCRNQTLSLNTCIFFLFTDLFCHGGSSTIRSYNSSPVRCKFLLVTNTSYPLTS